MAEPTLVTFSGRAAEMIVGGEFPIIVPGQQGTFTVEFREYGNRLNFVPIVLGNGRIRLEVRPELSQLDYANGVVFGGFTIPGLQQRRVETSVELNTGETFVIGGLLNTTDSATTNKVPYLGDMPLIGTAFRTVEYQQEEKELVIMVTPELTEPLKANQKLCGYPGSESTHPSNHELYLGGRFESPVCNDCESARRHELGVEIAHAQTARPGRVTKTIVTNSATAENSGRANTTAQQLAVPEQQPSEAQRPANLPGLLGPLGYDAGR
jgi:pilus assembly protein CpaC